MLYVTERAVFALDANGLVLTEIAPGIDLERDVLAQAGGQLKVSPSLRQMRASIFSSEPMGLACCKPWAEADRVA